MALNEYQSASETRPTVLWTRGSGCGELAAAIAPETSRRVDDDLPETCRRVRTDLVVTRRLSSFDLVPIVVPYDLALDQTHSVVAAVGGGPHTILAARVANWVGATLDVPTSIVCGFGGFLEEEEARTTLLEVAAVAPEAETRVVETESPSDLIEDVDENTLLVVGAPGGSWLQRQFFGAGAKLRSRAPGGAVVVRTAPRRAFHVISQATAVVSPHLGSGDALRLAAHAVLPVADGGLLVGVVRRSALLMVGHGVVVRTVMEDPVGVLIDTPLDEVEEVSLALGGSPVPVIDSSKRLLGVVGP